MKTPESEYELHEAPVTARSDPSRSPSAPISSAVSVHRFPWFPLLVWTSIISLCLAHVALIWISMEKWEGLTSDWPLLQADHGIHYRHGLLSRHFLKTTGMSAGYDPGFMSGYPMSIISDLSATFSNLVMMAGGDRPALGYKIHVFGCSAVVPGLIALASLAWRVKPVGVLVAVSLYIIYFWTDFPVRYASLGMLNYLLSVPLGLLCVAGLTGYFERGGFARWLWACGSASAVFLVHVTSPLLVGPAGLLAYAVACIVSRRTGNRFPLSRHVGLWVMVPVILLVNFFWLWPGYLLWSTKGPSDISFAHPEGVWKRVSEIFWKEMPILGILIGMALVGLAFLGRRRPVVAAGLGGFLAAGFSWGYLAGWFRVLDSLQPGRHTYALYSAACLASGIGLAEVFERLRSVRLGKWVALALILVGIRIFGPSLDGSLRANVFANVPFLSSRPTPRIVWVLDQVKRHLQPGERLLFEETGLGLPGLIDPYDGRHCSAIIPSMAGIELIGGPYLHSTIITNFTQFGENKLFEMTNWNLDYFVRYARYYRPSAICCWSPKARGFCLANPDLVQILADDGVVLVGRIIGFEGSTIRGKATVKAGPNRLVVTDATADPDSSGTGLVVLRYHSVPYLKTNPPSLLKEVLLPDDPVPFIGIMPTAGPLTIEMVLPPRKR